MGEQFGQAFPARNRGSGRPLPPFRNRIKLKKDDTSFLLTPTGVFFLALSPIPYGIIFFLGTVCQQGEKLRWSKQRIGIRKTDFEKRLQEYTCEQNVKSENAMDIAANIGVES